MLLTRSKQTPIVALMWVVTVNFGITLYQMLMLKRSLTAYAAFGNKKV